MSLRLKMLSIPVLLAIAAGGPVAFGAYTLVPILPDPNIDPNNVGQLYAQAINNAGEITGYDSVSSSNGPLRFGFSGQIGSGSTIVVQNLGYVQTPDGSTNLGPSDPEYPTGAQSWGFGINASGVKTGAATAGNSTQGNGLYTLMSYTGKPNTGGSMQSLGAPALDQAISSSAVIGTSISTGGTIVGVSAANGASDRRYHAFVYTPGPTGGITDLSAGSDVTSAAYAVNSTGNTAVGFVTTGTTSAAGASSKVATKWTLGSDGSWTQTSLGISTQAVAYAVNDSGQIVGTKGNAFLIQPDGTLVQLTSVGGNLASNSNPTGDINSINSSGLGNLFNSNMKALNVAEAINNLGQIVGYTGGSYVGRHAFYATVDANNVPTLIDLNTLIDPSSGWVLQEATGINDLGQIVGIGSFNGTKASFVLNPVGIPAPSATGLALAGVAAMARRRRRQVFEQLEKSCL